MSISLIQDTGSTVLSAGNDNISTVSGTTLGGPNVFDYKFIADIYVNGVLQVTLKSFPDPTYGFGVFNTRNILNSFMSFDFFPNAPSPASALFTACPNSSARVKLIYGEEYTSGSTFVQNRNLISGNTSVYVNASQSYTDQIVSGMSNYSFNTSGFWLSERLTSSTFISNPTSASSIVYDTFTNQKEPLYFLSNQTFTSGSTGFVYGIQIQTYNAAGSQIGRYVISNTVSGTTDVVCFNASYSAIASISASGSTVQVQLGTFPIFGPLVVYYRVSKLIVTGVGGGVATASMIYRPQVDCGRTAPGAYNLVWLNTLGGFNSWLFNKKNETTQTKETQTYKRTQGAIQSNGSYTLNTYSRNQQPYYTVLQDEIVMNTDLLTDAQVLYLKTLFSSPVVYMIDQAGLITSVVVNTNDYRIRKKINQKIYALELKVKQSYNDYRQIL